jgi:HAD superfamily hydrolase (TIGR01509 family)
MKPVIKALIFDWGNTVMRDFPECPGPMASWEHVEWIPFAEQALKELHQKYICCIASNAGFSDTTLMIDALKRVGAEKYFKHFFTSLDLGFEKPDIRFFTAICMHNGIEPDDCIMIGNDYKKDIEGAKKIGMTTVFFNENNDQGNFPDADYIIQSMQELISLLKN